MKSRMNTILATGLLTFMMSCAHTVKPVAISPTSDAATEISMHSTTMEEAYTAQVDVLAPDTFQKARKYFNEAKADQKDNESKVEVFEALGYSKSYLQKATAEAQKVQTMMKDILDARAMAITAGARKNPETLARVDKKFTSITDNDKITMNSEEIRSLQSDYLALELTSMKENYLGHVTKLMKEAKTKNADTITPKGWETAQEKFNAAEKLIETDRHNSALITPAVTQATISAQRVLGLLQAEKKSRNQSPEQRAVSMEAKDIALTNSDNAKSVVIANSAKKDQTIALQEKTLEQKDETISDQETVLASSAEENREMKAHEMDEQAVKAAAARFDSSEADVYRQDGLLIIRLKSMNFASGRSDLPASSLAVLAKVKDVIEGFGPGQVTVEGHTDGVGAAKLNQKLSENRAESVMKYFNSDDFRGTHSVSFVGYGYSKPLGTNKTKEGRTQNRRVDILIKPNQAI